MIYKVEKGVLCQAGEYKDGLPYLVNVFQTKNVSVFYDYHILADPEGERISVKSKSPWAEFVRTGNFVFIKQYLVNKGSKQVIKHFVLIVKKEDVLIET